MGAFNILFPSLSGRGAKLPLLLATPLAPLSHSR